MAGKASKTKVTVTFPPSWNQQGTNPNAKPSRYRRGRPSEYASVDALEDAIESYFNECLTEKEMANKAGLAVHLNVTRTTLHRWEDDSHEFSNAIKKAYAVIEDWWIRKLPYGHAAGNIFYLKNAFGYRDVVENPGGGTTINFLVAPEIAAKYGLPAKPVPAQVIDAPKEALPAAPANEHETGN